MESKPLYHFALATTFFCMDLAWGGGHLNRYYGHDTKLDANSVIASWYQEPNGPLDLRVRSSLETFKRFPWVTRPQAIRDLPLFMISPHWKITPDGQISGPQAVPNSANGDLVDLAHFNVASLRDAYAYTGDPTLIPLIHLQIDHILDHCQTPPTHAWPGFVISVPAGGKTFFECDPRGYIQLDIAALFGYDMLKAYQLTGEKRWFDTAKHWGHLFAKHRLKIPNQSPWNRYADRWAVPWGAQSRMTGGVVFIARFLSELIDLGYLGAHGEIVQARDAADHYLRETLLPVWARNKDTWGNFAWDHNGPNQIDDVTTQVAQYLMDNKSRFPGWRRDVRNIISLSFNRNSVHDPSHGDTYSGAWQFPESPDCCERSIGYEPRALSWSFARYGNEARSAWAREIARRIALITSYDFHENGYVEDKIDGGTFLSEGWLKVAHPHALYYTLKLIGELPELFAPQGENHLVRSSEVIDRILYSPGRIEYSSFKASANTTDVLRISFPPESIKTDDGPLKSISGPRGYQIKKLNSGDYIVTVRRAGSRRVLIEGSDRHKVVPAHAIVKAGVWSATAPSTPIFSSDPTATLRVRFFGNAIRIDAQTVPDGGTAAVDIDGVRQATLVSFYSKRTNDGTVYALNGLKSGWHELTLTSNGQGNVRPKRQGRISFSRAIAFETPQAPLSWQEQMPAEAQRVIMGYDQQTDFIDSKGRSWRPGTEFVNRLGPFGDAFDAWWSTPGRVDDVPFAERTIYQYGVHGKDFKYNFTVGPGRYRVTLHFADNRDTSFPKNKTRIAINGKDVVEALNVAEETKGKYKSFRLSYDDIRPKNGIIAVRLVGGNSRDATEAFVQAIEVEPQR